MAQLSEWLRIMLEEIARKQDEASRALLEQKQREAQAGAAGQPG
ncbi:MAG: hypothetical protein WDO12_04070 [Pseudomonadota bacterium]